MGALELWMIFVIIAIAATIFEIFVPLMFCINFAFAAVITAIISIWWGDFSTLLIIFCVLSLLSIIFIKPIIQKMLIKHKGVDFVNQYIGKVVKVIEPVNMTQGAVTIYDERWEARTEYDTGEIPAGTSVKIVKNDNLILFVEKV